MLTRLLRSRGKNFCVYINNSLPEGDKNTNDPNSKFYNKKFYSPILDFDET